MFCCFLDNRFVQWYLSLPQNHRHTFRANFEPPSHPVLLSRVCRERRLSFLTRAEHAREELKSKLRKGQKHLSASFNLGLLDDVFVFPKKKKKHCNERFIFSLCRGKISKPARSFWLTHGETDLRDNLVPVFLFKVAKKSPASNFVEQDTATIWWSFRNLSCDSVLHYMRPVC